MLEFVKRFVDLWINNMKSVLIIDSLCEKNNFLLSLLAGLPEDAYSFYLLEQNSKLTKSFNKKGWQTSKIWLGPNIKNIISQILFISVWPAFLIVYFFIIAFYKFSKKINCLICLGLNEKIIITPLANIFKIKAIWLENPDTNYQLIPNIIFKFYKLFSKQAIILSSLSYKKTQLKNLGLSENNIIILPQGIKVASPKHQENIFSDLAKLQPTNFSKKYFTVGAVIDLNKPNQIENLFMAAKKCLTVIPNLQLMVVSEGQEVASQAGQACLRRQGKNLNWLTKKIGINNIVWFVSEQARLKKWLDSFDVLVTVCSAPAVSDLEIILRAMANKLPIIGPRNIGLEDLILENKTGYLLEADNNEALAQQIITLFKNKRLRINLGKTAHDLIDKDFRLEIIVKQFNKILQ